MIHELTTIALRSLGIVVVVLLIAGVARKRRPGLQPRVVSAAAVAVLSIGIAVSQMSGSVKMLTGYRDSAVAAEAGRDECFSEQTPTPGTYLYTRRLPFAVWARRQMGAGAVYSLGSFISPPDDLCLYFALLPALPAAPGQKADWTIAYGSVPDAMRSRIAAHDRSVKVFAPGFALQADVMR